MNYVVVGASAAGINAVKTLRTLDASAKITLVSKDEAIYSRCILHHYLEDSRNVPELSFVEPDFIQKYNIDWRAGICLKGLDTDAKTVLLSDETTLPYDKLLLATGASTFFPPITGLADTNNVVGLRNLEDAVVIKEKAATSENIVIMGAGLVGIDAIAGLLETNSKLTLIETQSRLLPAQLDGKAADTYQEAFAKKEVCQYYKTYVREVVKNEEGAVAQIKLSTGVTLPCDLLIVATGVRANVEFLESTGITTDELGLVFDGFGQTNVTDVYGAGDVSGRMPIWPTAVKEGIIAASNMAGVKKEMTDFFASKSTMNFLNIATLSLGVPNAPDETYTVDIKEDELGNYKKIIHKEGVIYGAIIQGDLAYAGVLTQLIKEKIPVDKLEKSIFDIDYSDFFQQTGDFQFKY